MAPLARPISSALRVVTGALLLTAATGFVSCASTQPQVFDSPQVAVDTLVVALRADDKAALHKILGSEADKLLDSGDAVSDAHGRAEFLRLYDEKHGFEPGGDDAMTLDVGASDWPFPAPVVKDGTGWSWDTASGLDELLSRRIGRNELDAIQICRAIIDAEREYAAADANGDGWREYARTFRSDAGKKNGLYWETAPGEPESPLGDGFSAAEAAGYQPRDIVSNTSQPFHGYYFRILTEQGPAAPGGAIDYVAQGHMIGGFGLIAWPVQYANSGLKTFIASHQGAVYEKDLGDDTDRIARGITAFNPEAGWNPCAAPADPR